MNLEGDCKTRNVRMKEQMLFEVLGGMDYVSDGVHPRQCRPHETDTTEEKESDAE